MDEIWILYVLMLSLDCAMFLAKVQAVGPFLVKNFLEKEECYAEKWALNRLGLRGDFRSKAWQKKDLTDLI